MSQRIAIITGASGGLGYEFAVQLAQESPHLEFWLSGRNEEKLAQLASELEVKSRIIPGDICALSWQEDFQTLLEQEKPVIETLICSAGMAVAREFSQTSPEASQATVNLNCTALTALNAYCLPYMQPGSRILNVSSVSAFMPQVKFAVYAATKSYVLNYSRALHRELKSQGITVTAVCPNPLPTSFAGQSSEREDLQGIKSLGLESVEKVVQTALRRSAQGKDLSLSSFLAQLVRFIAKVLPHRLVLWYEEKFWL